SAGVAWAGSLFFPARALFASGPDARAGRQARPAHAALYSRSATAEFSRRFASATSRGRMTPPRYNARVPIRHGVQSVSTSAPRRAGMNKRIGCSAALCVTCWLLTACNDGAQSITPNQASSATFYDNDGTTALVVNDSKTLERIAVDIDNSSDAPRNWVW